MDRNLVRLQEECAEVIHIVSKIHRFGLDNWNPEISHRVKNYELLAKELGDLVGVISMITKNKKYKVTQNDLEIQARRKIEKIKEWNR